MAGVNISNPTAGSAEPYWFEWKTGLLRLVELLDQDSEIVGVAFQLHGTKGWDDVGVRFRDGRTQLLQMKHSRTGENITFGDLVTAESEHSPSLLRALARAWKDEQASRGTVECVLVTNRSGGTNWYQGRPPLAEFFEKVKARSVHAASINHVEWGGEDERYSRAWQIFIAELSDLQEPEKLAFLQALRVELDAPDLNALETGIRARLTALTGLPPSSVNALFNALVANLRTWTCQTRREKDWINRETLCACLAANEDAPPWLGHCEVETPDPFFPSRNAAVETLGVSLLSKSPHKVDFLAAEPGAGKTSCISKLARSGTVLWKEQCVSIRFYAYRPIRPGHRDVGSDGDVGVRPEALWLGLLWQIREHLRKTHLLAELHVPVWLDGLPWEIARDHVLRIADTLGSRWERCFVICIDGIDHAARARRKHLPDFLGTLPGPEAIPVHVRFLLAGQPADAYPEYPFFLRHAHEAVKVHPLDTLTDADLQVLWRAAKPQLPVQIDQALIRLLAEKAQRRTLPTVYAVEDIRNCATLEEAARVLDARPLADPLHDYYDAIWSVAAATATDGPRLAAAFALLRERPTGSLMASAFSALGKSVAGWEDTMRRLRPLVRETNGGFELVHNDLRVHLEASLAMEPFARRDAASALADHYRKPESNRLAAHLSVLDLLTTAERRDDFADDFTTEWVIEADAHGVSNEQLASECSAAFVAAVRRQDWLVLHAVGCASLTLHRLQECLSNSDRDQDPVETRIVPTFLPVEGEPLPFELWSPSDFSEVLSACQQLFENGAQPRAALVLAQWFTAIPVETLVERMADSLKGENERREGSDVLRRDLERFGRLCALCRFAPASVATDPKKNSGYRGAVETGWVRGLAELTNRREALRLWCWREPQYIAPWVEAVREAASRERWGEVRALLNRMEGCRDNIDAGDRLTLGWYAARAKPRSVAVWQQSCSLPNYGLHEGATSLSMLRLVAGWITYGAGNREPAQVTEDLLPLLDQRESESKNSSAVAILIRASAVIGRLLRYADRKDFAGAAIAVPPTALAPLLDALWCEAPDWRNLPHQEVRTPKEVGNTLAQIAWNCGASYRDLLCDLAKRKFAGAMLWDEGRRAFDMLLDCGEHEFLKQAVESKVSEIVERLHEDEASSRNSIVANLLHFARRLDLVEVSAQLMDRLRRTRIGYTSHKEWVFQPLARWFDITRKATPSAWRDEGMQLLALDRICEQQNGDNGFGDAVTAQVAAAAMECGANDFEALFVFLASRGAKYPLWDLAKATQDGFEICLRDEHLMSEETTLARVAIAVALGRWPTESALKTVSALLTAHGVPQYLGQQPAWIKAVRVAAEIQGLPPQVAPRESSGGDRGESLETRNAEAILDEILHPRERSWINLGEIANLAKQARAENRPDRDALVSSALGALESSSEPLSRCLEFHDGRLMSRLYQNLTEQERWRLIGAITAVTGEMRKQLSSDPNWAFMVAFSAVDHACCDRAAADRSFGLAAFHQLLKMHWQWHGTLAPVSSVTSVGKTATWPDAARQMLLSLTETDACETLYMAMSGIRFFVECFPHQIPAICRAGLADDRARDAILSLAQMWATRLPHALEPALPFFADQTAACALEDRLDAWAVTGLHNLTLGRRPQSLTLPSRDAFPEIAFPGDGQLFEGEEQMIGLMRHNSFARMANKRVQRAGIVLGSMERAFRHMALAVKNGSVDMPSFNVPPPRTLTFDSYSPRQRHSAERLAGDAILYQDAGRTWSPPTAAGVRMLMGYGLDPWIASATPNIWPDKETWPSDFDIERGVDNGAPRTDTVDNRLRALLDGEDLDPSLLLLGAVLHVPTYRRDMQFDFWLTAPTAKASQLNRPKLATPTGRTLAGWLTGWSFAAKSADKTSVHFVGTLINYPHSDLDITPTDYWTQGWGWRPDHSNPLRFLSRNGRIVAWYERWLGPDSITRRVCRQPLLNRWVARRDSFPAADDELRAWERCTDYSAGLLSQPD